MGKVVSLLEKTEKWSTSYVSPDGDVQIKTSSHGRITIQTGRNDSRHVRLDFFESVRMLSRVTEDMEINFKV